MSLTSEEQKRLEELEAKYGSESIDDELFSEEPAVSSDLEDKPGVLDALQSGGQKVLEGIGGAGGAATSLLGSEALLNKLDPAMERAQRRGAFQSIGGNRTLTGYNIENLENKRQQFLKALESDRMDAEAGLPRQRMTAAEKIGQDVIDADAVTWRKEEARKRIAPKISPLAKEIEGIVEKTPERTPRELLERFSDIIREEGVVDPEQARNIQSYKESISKQLKEMYPDIEKISTPGIGLGRSVEEGKIKSNELLRMKQQIPFERDPAPGISSARQAQKRNLKELLEEGVKETYGDETLSKYIAKNEELGALLDKDKMLEEFMSNQVRSKNPAITKYGLLEKAADAYSNLKGTGQAKALGSLRKGTLRNLTRAGATLAGGGLGMALAGAGEAFDAPEVGLGSQIEREDRLKGGLANNLARPEVANQLIDEIQSKNLENAEVFMDDLSKLADPSTPEREKAAFNLIQQPAFRSIYERAIRDGQRKKIGKTESEERALRELEQIQTMEELDPQFQEQLEKSKEQQEQKNLKELYESFRKGRGL